MSENYCSDCESPLPLGAVKCSCGWERQKAEGGIKCLCGRNARIMFQDKYLCWDCYNNTVAGTEYEDWRAKELREKAKELGIYPENGDFSGAAFKARKLLKEMGGIGKLVEEKVK